jgi:hypothetical protein
MGLSIPLRVNLQQIVRTEFQNEDQEKPDQQSVIKIAFESSPQDSKLSFGIPSLLQANLQVQGVVVERVRGPVKTAKSIAKVSVCAIVGITVRR